jgi:alpha-mannosidase
VFQGAARAAIFHAGVPAWAAQHDGLVVGALWRNAMQERCDIYGAQGSDPHEVTVSYALRISTGIREPSSGQQLREALAFETPLLAVAGRPSGNLPRSFSLAAASPPQAIITAAKAGTADPTVLVLRIYQPTNAALRMRVRTGARLRFPRDSSLSLEAMTALETVLPRKRAEGLDLHGRVGRFDFVARRALTTIGIRGSHAR